MASNAHAEDGVTIAELSGRLAALQRAWASDTALQSHAETFRALDMAIPNRGSAERSDPMQPVRGALAYLGQFHERGLPRTLIEWLASGEPRARVATVLQHVATVSRAIEGADAAEQEFARAARVDARTWYGEWPRGASFALRMARFDRTIEGAGTLAA